MTIRSSLHRLGVVLTILVMLAVPVVGGSTQPVLAQDDAGAATDLIARTAATYSVDAGAEAVRVRIEYAFTNPANGVAYPGFFESLPEGAEAVDARSGGRTLDSGPFGERDGFAVWAVAFPRPLDPGESIEVTLEWVWPADDGDVVIEPRAMSFPVYASGVAGAPMTPVTVAVPAGFELRAPAAAELVEEVATGATWQVPVDDAYRLVPVGLVATTPGPARVATDDEDLALVDYADDGEWGDAVDARLTEVRPELERWFGPRTGPVEVHRALPGTARDPFDTLASPTPVIDLDSSEPAEIDRALALVWMAETPVDDTWVLDGFAAAFADAPADTAAAGAVASVADEIGGSGVRAVVDALRAGSISYPGSVPLDQPIPPDWRTVLDLLDEVGGADDAAQAFLGGVVDVDGADAIARRATARIDLLALRARAGAWSLPPLLRVPMAAWEFDTAAARQGAVSDAVATRDGLDTRAADLDLAPIEPAREAFEAATESMEETEAVLAEQSAALEAFDEAERLVNGDRGVLAWLGLWGRDPKGDLERTRAHWAAGDLATVEASSHAIVDEIDSAVGRGTARLLFPIMAAVVIGWMVQRIRRRRRDGRLRDVASPQPA